MCVKKRIIEDFTNINEIENFLANHSRLILFDELNIKKLIKIQIRIINIVFFIVYTPLIKLSKDANHYFIVKRKLNWLGGPGRKCAAHPQCVFVLLLL